MIRAVLFDFDDTLVKTKEIRYAALKDAGSKFYHLNITDADIDKFWGLPFNQFMVGIFNNAADVDTLTKNYKSIIHKYPNRPFPDTNEVLNKISAKYLMGIISSSNPGLIKSGMENVKINPELFFFIQSSEDTEVHKPNPEVFRPTLERLKQRNINGSEIIYVGDAIDDYQASTNSGIHFIAIADRTVSDVVFKENNIPFIRSITELPEYIESIK